MLSQNFFLTGSLLGLVIAAPQGLEDRALIKRAPMITCNNGGKALCCKHTQVSPRLIHLLMRTFLGQGTFAGDLPLIKTLAGLTSFPLNPNDVNCISGECTAS
jgi:hypothetical protein